MPANNPGVSEMTIGVDEAEHPVGSTRDFRKYFEQVRDFMKRLIRNERPAVPYDAVGNAVQLGCKDSI